MASPADRRYLPTHEWHKLEGGLVVIGLSQFAVEELTDITFLDIKKKAGPIRPGESFGEIESVKATSELYCGLAGTVVAFNQQAIDSPALINQDPFGQGWLVKVQPADLKQLEALLSAADYDRQHA
jgi:glycine cleavage system H protein